MLLHPHSSFWVLPSPSAAPMQVGRFFRVFWNVLTSGKKCILIEFSVRSPSNDLIEVDGLQFNVAPFRLL